ncbi:MAG: ribonuclease HII [Candidatus Thermoplasmatota archaeon]|nr:ribonuclease HII [Candidatus Thermoplasmatota archaeon]
MIDANMYPPMAVGIDEAGRGPVIGPMLVCALYCRDPERLRELGVRDSKLMDRVSRENIGDRLEGISSWTLVELPASAIDLARRRMSLNELEVISFASAVSSLVLGRGVLHPKMPEGCAVDVDGKAPECAVLMDAADVDEMRFTKRVKAACSDIIDVASLSFLGRHRADSEYPEVSAASILAKVRRDRRVEEISREIGSDIGSGYPSDPNTIAFLKGYLARWGDLPPHTRRSWDTARALLSCRRNRTLGDF